MTPKFLLRHPRAASSLSDLSEGAFRPVLDDLEARERADEVTRVLLCSGKIYVDLVTGAAYPVAADNVAVVRVEELYPFPAREIQNVLSQYRHAREVFWVQEEPCNMGAWSFVESQIRDLLPRTVDFRYVGRPESASPAEGSQSQHIAEQARIVSAALTALPERPKPKLKRSGVTHVR
jgi:2-oxoglutarate dehydrogenase E1 component